MASSRLALAVAPEQLAIADDALALGADVDEDLVLVDADDLPSTTSPCLKLLMSESCSARSSSIVVGSGPRSRAGAGSSSSSLAAGASAVSSALSASPAGSGPVGGWPLADASIGVAADSSTVARRCFGCRVGGRCDRLVGWRRGRVDGCALRFGGRAGVVGAGGGLVCNGNRREGLIGRLVGGGGARLRLRRGPALLLFGQGSGHSCGGFAPENHERPERRSSRVRNVQVVRGDRLRGPLLRASNGLVCRSCAVHAPWGRESLARAFRPATIAAPCPNCPI